MENKIEKTVTLETEVKKFANDLSYWQKFLAEKILSNSAIFDIDIETSYSYLLEELTLIEATERPAITISCNSKNVGDYKSNLLLSKLDNVEGVNALIENQTIEFNPKLTIIYGANGSGKSGYVRLLKKVFYSKSAEEILPNVHIENGHKPINAKFTFTENNADISLDYSDKGKGSSEFQQFSVFDGKSVLSHLEQKNEFIFRPAGLSFFADYTKAIEKVEEKLNIAIDEKQSKNEFELWFEGDSEIKVLVKNFSATTKIEHLNKHTPFSNEDSDKKLNLQKQYDELFLTSKSKEKQISNLNNIKRLLDKSKIAIEKINQCFSSDSLAKVKDIITDCIAKEATAKTEGIEYFKTDKIEGIGTEEWKNFIVSAEAFAKKQKLENTDYPEKSDNCLLCHQPLSDDAEKLITNYWKFIRSVAEENARKAQENLDEVKLFFKKQNFDLFPENDVLTVWLVENNSEELKTLKGKLSEQKTLSDNIVSDIENKTAHNRMEIKSSIEQYTTITGVIDTSLQEFQKDGQSKELERLLKEKTFLEHKEKFNTHFPKFKTYIENQAWIEKAKKANYTKRNITNTEKILSNKYFNQKYVDSFNRECQKLNGNFGIEINHIGVAGKSYRELKLKGKTPNAVLSEGEQKVIAIADFITEMQLSDINRGIIFDDPVNSLDEARKSNIAQRLIGEAKTKQVIIFTHDLVFVSSIISFADEMEISHDSHWIESENGDKGKIWLKNAPSYEKNYKNSGKATAFYELALKAQPEERETQIRHGFSALRTSYEALVIFDLFEGVVQRFNERVSIDSLSKVFVDEEIKNEIIANFHKCCSYMEGHLHSDKYSCKKIPTEILREEIEKFNTVKKSIKEIKKKI